MYISVLKRKLENLVYTMLRVHLSNDVATFVVGSTKVELSSVRLLTGDKGAQWNLST